MVALALGLLCLSVLVMGVTAVVALRNAWRAIRDEERRQGERRSPRPHDHGYFSFVLQLIAEKRRKP